MGGRRSGWPGFVVALGLSLVLVLSTALGAGCSQPAQSSYPTKGIQLTVAFAAGGSTDLVARVLAEYMSKEFGQPINVVNMAGGGGTTGTLAVLQAPPDGYQLLMQVIAPGTLNPATISDLPYKYDTPTHISRINVMPIVFATSVEKPWKTLKELVDDIKKGPDKFSFGTGAATGVSTFAAAQLLEAGGVDPTKVKSVVFQGGAPAMVAVAGGHVDFAGQNLAEVLPLVEGKKVRPLAVTTAERCTQLPDVPTTKEAGFGKVTIMGWNGLVGPPKLPESIVKRWDDGIQKLMKDPKFLADLEQKAQATPAYLNGKDFATFVENEYKYARDYAEKLGLRK